LVNTSVWLRVPDERRRRRPSGPDCDRATDDRHGGAHRSGLRWRWIPGQVAKLSGR
jgi:hypothetical protein